MVYFFIVYSLLFIILAIKQPKLALFLICALLPTYQLRFKILGLPTTVLEVMIVILFAYWLINKLKTQKSKLKTTTQNLKISNWFWLILAWLIIGLVAVSVSPNKFAGLGHWRAYFLEPILLLIVFIDLSKREIKESTHTNKQNNYFTIRASRGNDYPLPILVLFGLGISALYISIWAIYQKIFGGGMLSLEVWQYPFTKIWRVTGPFPHSNFLGLFLGPIIMLSFGQLIGNWKNKKPLVISYWLFVIIAGFVAIIFARSEGAILGILAGLIFFLFCLLPSKKRLFFLVLLLVIGSLLFVISPWRNYLLEKITFQDLSSQLRLNIWQGTIELLKDKPIFGAGLRGYQKLIPQYQKPFYHPETSQLISVETHPYPHNLFLAIWAELGIFGLVIFILIVFNFFKLGFKKLFRNLKLEIRNSEPAKSEKILIVAILSAMVTILIHGTVDTPYFKNDLSVLFWLIIGLMISFKKT